MSRSPDPPRPTRRGTDPAARDSRQRTSVCHRPSWRTRRRARSRPSDASAPSHEVQNCTSPGVHPFDGWTLFTESAIFIDVVNKPKLVNLEGPLEAGALQILRGIPGLAVIAQPGGADRGVDPILRFAGTRVPVAVEFKRRANPATAWQLVHDAHERPDKPILLIAGETTAEARKILQEHGITVIDGLGNAHIELPGLLFHLEGHGRPEQKVGDAPPTRLKGKAGVVAQALLLHHNRAWQVKNLAEEARVSGGLAHRVLARLETEGIVAAQGAGLKRVRRITDTTALLDPSA